MFAAIGVRTAGKHERKIGNGRVDSGVLLPTLHAVALRMQWLDILCGALLAKCSRYRLVNLQRKACFNIGHRVAN
jgi:hypothetical protein